MKRGRNQRRRQGVNINRAFDSNGPDVRIRGTANQIYDKYLALARDATSAGDRVKAENYFQHAEHYFRVIRSMQPQTHIETSDADGDQPAIGDSHERSNGNGADHGYAQGGDDEAGEAAPRHESRQENRQERQSQRTQENRPERGNPERGNSESRGSGESRSNNEPRSNAENGERQAEAAGEAGEAGEGARRPRRRRPRRTARPEGEEAGESGSDESAEAAVG